MFVETKNFQNKTIFFFCVSTSRLRFSDKKLAFFKFNFQYRNRKRKCAMCFGHPVHIPFFFFRISVDFRQLCYAFENKVSTFFQTHRGRVATFLISSRNVHFSSRINTTSVASLPRVVFIFSIL